LPGLFKKSNFFSPIRPLIRSLLSTGVRHLGTEHATCSSVTAPVFWVQRAVLSTRTDIHCVAHVVRLTHLDDTTTSSTLGGQGDARTRLLRTDDSR